MLTHTLQLWHLNNDALGWHCDTVFLVAWFTLFQSTHHPKLAKVSSQNCHELPRYKLQTRFTLLWWYAFKTSFCTVFERTHIYPLWYTFMDVTASVFEGLQVEWLSHSHVKHSSVYSILLESTWINIIMVLHGKSQEWTCDPWFVKILRMQRSSEVHIDSTFLHRCRVGALIYDSEAGWSHKDPQSITKLYVASADPGLYMSDPLSQ